MSKKIITAILAILVVIVSASTMIRCYEKVETIARSDNESSIVNLKEYLYNYGNLETTVYAIKNRLQNTENRPASENLLTITGSEQFVNAAKQIFDDQYFWRWNQHISEDVNLHYYALDKNTNRELWNDEKLKNLQNMDGNEDYQILIQVNYDEYGTLTIQSSDYGVKTNEVEWSRLFNAEAKSLIENYIQRDAEYALQQWQTLDGNTEAASAYGIIKDESELTQEMNSLATVAEENSEFVVYNVKLNAITNMSFLFAVPSDLESTDPLYWNNSWILENSYQENAAIFSLVISFFVILLSLFFPILVVRDWSWFRAISRIKAEVLIIILVLILGFSFAGGIALAMWTQEGTVTSILTRYQLDGSVGEISLFVNLFVWCIYYFCLMICAFMIRYIFNIGFINYIKQNTVLFWLFRSIVHGVYGIGHSIDTVLNFDFRDPINKTIVKFVFINFLALSIFCFFFILGPLFGIVYSIVLFICLEKKAKKIQENYLVLLRATHELSEGNFDIPIEEDVGCFNSLKEEFTELKTGFEKAVSEEVKSQKMKTELISNVSHDLKTPLTSIITYVDLLKQSGIDEETRIQYLNTIDRNSQRLKNLISDLFEISKANSGNVSLCLVEMDVVNCIHQVLFECQEKIKEQELDFILNFNQDKMILNLDSLKTYRIFENLVVNICKYAMKGTRVYIEGTDLGDEVLLVFKNISNSQLKFDENELTERFVQGDKSRNTEGSGLGLAIVKSFTQLQNGSFHIEMDGDLFKAILVFKREIIPSEIETESQE